MNRKVFYLGVLAGFLVLMMAAPPWTLAQSSGTAFRQEELDQMLAPIALYPDSLLGQILVAATYPDQVIEADQWLRHNSIRDGNELNAALDRMDWDLSVKALVPFPQVLSMMSDKNDWTQRMGDAFLAQQGDVMDTIQRLRGKAHAQGNLNTTEQQRVVVRGESIEIVPINPRIVYVPTYNPAVIYGSWWYPSYPPYAYNPYYPGYAYDPYYTGAGFVTSGIFGFAAGIGVGSYWNSGWGHWDWGRRDVNINITRNININRNDLRAGSFRTTSWNRAVHQRTAGSARDGRLGSARMQGTQTGPAAATGLQGSHTRNTAASVQKGLQQRQNRVQARSGQSNRNAINAGRGDSTLSNSRGNSPRGEKAVTRNQKITPRGDSTLSNSRGNSLRGEKAVTRNQKITPRSDSNISNSRGNSLRGEKAVTRNQKITPRGDSNISNSRGNSLRGEKAVTRNQKITPRGDSNISNSRGNSLRGEKAVTRNQKITPRGDSNISNSRGNSLRRENAITRNQKDTPRGDSNISNSRGNSPRRENAVTRTQSRPQGQAVAPKAQVQQRSAPHADAQRQRQAVAPGSQPQAASQPVKKCVGPHC